MSDQRDFDDDPPPAAAPPRERSPFVYALDLRDVAAIAGALMIVVGVAQTYTGLALGSAGGALLAGALYLGKR